MFLDGGENEWWMILLMWLSQFMFFISLPCDLFGNILFVHPIITTIPSFVAKKLCLLSGLQSL